jgi:NADP-dependent 3-hydroxy acid dehydrogenase YdfG
MGSALVNGASSGIGLDRPKRFAEHSYELVIAAEDDGVQTATTLSPDRDFRGTAQPARR